MKFVRAEDVGFTKSAKTRGGTGHASRILFDSAILGRDPRSADNFYAGISVVGEGQFSAPRHRHNFDQFRYVIEGEADSGHGILSKGQLGYFPEGAFYGPQASVAGTVLIVQFGSTSGAGYIDRSIARVAYDEMKKLNTGYFEDGTYHRNPGVEGAPTQDSNEVIFEHVMKRPMEYPEPQYLGPLLINPEGFPWQEIEDQAGVSERPLGTFSSGKFSASEYKLEAGAKLHCKDRGIWLVLSGRGRIEGESYSTHGALYLEEGETATFAADEDSEILRLGLPALRTMRPNAIASVPEYA